jgi:hypothetical protein
MNEIASVELETASPLFFDPYDENRTTGSFILIDPITNATVAAGMIREDLSAGPQAAELSQAPGIAVAAQGPVTPEERYKRQGHYPALILVEDNPALAARLERALFDEHFHVLLVSSDAVPFDALERILPMYQSLGLVVIYSCAALTLDAKRRLSAIAPQHFLDSSALGLPAEDADAARSVISMMHSVRTGVE